MKVSIIFFVLFALAFARPEFGGEGIADRIIADMQSDLDILGNRITNMAFRIQSKSDGLISKGQNQVRNIASGVEKTFKTIVALGGDAKKCVLQKANGLIKVQENYMSTVKACGVDIVKTVVHSEIQLLERANEIQTTLSEGRESIENNCKDEAHFAKLVCIFDAVGDVQNEFSEGMKKVKQDLNEAKIRTQESLENVQTCVRQTVDSANFEGDTITASFKQCESTESKPDAGGSKDGESGAGSEGSGDAGSAGVDGNAGADGSAGTGADGSTGTGTGADGSADTGADGSAGTGVDGNTGTGADGSTGTGADGSTGTGADGSTGTGADGSAPAGSGAESNAPAESGAESNAPAAVPL